MNLDEDQMMAALVALLMLVVIGGLVLLVTCAPSRECARHERVQCYEGTEYRGVIRPCDQCVEWREVPR